MSTVSVIHGFNTFKCRVEPGYVLNDVLITCLIHFKLSTDEQAWSLVHAERELPLSLPWKLLNLPAGAKLKLKATSKNGKNLKPIRIKFQIAGLGSKIVVAQQMQTVLEVVEELCKENDWEIKPDHLKLQIFAKVLRYEDMLNTTFSALGIHDDVSVRLTLSSEPHKSTTNSVGYNAPKKEDVDSSSSEDHPAQISAQKEAHKIHEISTYTPSDTSSIPTVDENESTYEVTVNHVRKYQEMLSKKAGSGVMLTKRLREEQEKDTKREVDNCNIRIRFPDRTHIEVCFKPDETIDAVYEIVEKSLFDSKMPFWLSYSHPHQKVEKSGQKLENDLHFGSKTLLLFESSQEGPYLNQALLQSAKDISEAADVKLDRSDIVANVNENERKAEHTKDVPIKHNKGVLTGKTPKWLKLSKK